MEIQVVTKMITHDVEVINKQYEENPEDNPFNYNLEKDNIYIVKKEFA